MNRKTLLWAACLLVGFTAGGTGALVATGETSSARSHVLDTTDRPTEPRAHPVYTPEPVAVATKAPTSASAPAPARRPAPAPPRATSAAPSAPAPAPVAATSSPAPAPAPAADPVVTPQDPSEVIGRQIDCPDGSVGVVVDADLTVVCPAPAG